MGYLFSLSKHYPEHTIRIFHYVKDLPHDSVSMGYKLFGILNIALDYFVKDIGDSVIYWYNEGIGLASKYSGYQKELAMFYREFGRFYTHHSNYANGIRLYNKAISISEKCGAQDDNILYVSELGNIYQSINENDKALASFLKAKEYSEKTKNTQLLLYALNALGDLSRISGNLDKALAFHESALDAQRKENGQNDLWACTSLGKIYTLKNDLDKAEMYFGIVLNDARSSTDLVSQSLLNLSRCEYKKGNIDQAIEKGLRAFNISLTSPDINIRNGITQNLAVLFTESKQFEKALGFYKMNKVIEDTLNNKEEIKKRAEVEFRLKEEKLVEKNKEEKEKRILETKRHNAIVAFITVVLIMVLVFAIFIYRSLQNKKAQNRIIQEQKRLVDDKQKDILDSIYYAQRIQESLLPSERYIEKQLKKLRN